MEGVSTGLSLDEKLYLVVAKYFKFWDEAAATDI